ncbi:hypothetical protein [Rhodococcoides corynebacterioides]|uniref:Secreted protein n=1 Tax=Rhodococcoides corynebacterioides TaxID=53972 RepID=A0ABS7P8C3_9NOCA|nr:hypothetical protein [Rhodococcus corynebacterioides]MBY6368669.1 hypothetical protein [Rhodococcus corynebacterioides]MBY6409678.1 hypothetical protein [Rhodococcus corynebacterioides]
MSNKLKKFVAGASVIVAGLVGPIIVAPSTAQAALPTVTVKFGDWRCSQMGGGKVVAVQMGSQYGSVPKAVGNTIRINAKVGTANNLTGAIWCKSWWRPVAIPVYNISQRIWVSAPNQHFNV